MKLLRSRWLLGISLLTSMCGAHSIRGDVYNSTNEFSISNGNPNGVWSYGEITAVGGTATLFTNHGNNGIPFWGFEQPSFANIWKNTNQQESYGVYPGQLSMHPGDADDLNALLRFTVPMSGDYSIALDYDSGDIGEVDITLAKNGTPLYFASNTDSGGSYVSTGVALAADDHIDVIVGRAGDWNFDNTPVNLTIALGTIPEPASITLLVLATALGIFHRYRK